MDGRCLVPLVLFFPLAVLRGSPERFDYFGNGVLVWLPCRITTVLYKYICILLRNLTEAFCFARLARVLSASDGRAERSVRPS